MVRFFVSPEDISGGAARLSAEDAAHVRSLRLRPSESFVVCDGEGFDYICRLGDRSGGGSAAEIIETLPSCGEPTVRCAVFVAYAQGDRLDYAVQKSVELGAREIVLFPSARCEAIPRDVAGKVARLRRIALEAAKQSGRGAVPEVSASASFGEALELAARCSRLPLFLYEEEKERHLKEALERHDFLLPASDPRFSISIMSGPAGGFDPSEAALAKSAGLVTVSLGTRILRSETAPVAALAAVMFYTGNL